MIKFDVVIELDKFSPKSLKNDKDYVTEEL